MTTTVMMLAAAGTPSLSNTNTNGLTLGLSWSHGTTAMMTSSAPR